MPAERSPGNADAAHKRERNGNFGLGQAFPAAPLAS